MDMPQIFNSLEMFIWLIVGVIFFANGFRRSNRYKKLTFLLAAAYIAFGLSDGVEANTGAWWQPWWLLLWKVLCIVIFVISLVYYLWNERRFKNPLNPHN
jgi:phosphoglycerol transferase MdoB-like AlkP superfamily enzyme